MDDLDLALDKCLQQLAAGKWSLAQCLAKYPQHAAELRPLLEAAMQLQRGKTMRPSGALRDRTRSRVADYVDAHPRGGRSYRVSKVGILLVVLLLMLLFTTTAFAQNSLPGQALYALKLTSERAWRTAAPDPIKVDLTLANRRTDELVRLVSNKNASAHNASWNPNAESDAIAAYTDVLNRLDAETTEQNGDEILGLLEEHQSALSKAGVHVPRLDDLLQRAQSRKGEPTKPGSRP